MKKLLEHILLYVFILLQVSIVSAQNKVDSVKAILNTLDKQQRINALNDISNYYLNVDYNVDSCLKYAQISLELSKNIKNNYLTSLALRNIGITYYYEQKFDTSITIFRQAINEIEDVDSLQLKSNLYLYIGISYYYKGDFSNALEFWKKDLETNIKANDKELTAQSYMNIGVLYKNMDEYDQAISYYQDAFKILEELKDSTTMADVLNNIGNIYFQFRGNFNKALENYLKAVEIYKKKGNKEREAHLLNSIGLIYYKQEQLKLSLECFNLALSICEDNGLTDKFAEIQTNLGLLHAKLGNFQLANNYLKSSYEYYLKSSSKPRIAETLRDLGDVYSAWGKLKEALNYYSRSFDIFSELNMKSDISNLYKKFAEINAALKNYKNAYEYRLLYAHLNDSLFNEKLNEQITEIQTKYETEKKDKAIALLNKDKALQDAQLKRQRLTIWFFTVGFGVISILLILIFRLFKQKQKANVILEQKNEEISLQRDHIFQQNKEITDSIEYASRIQTALLPPQELIEKVIPDSFILFKPRDIVSGDFYWLSEKGNKIISVTADCTGHGVPGAFMSMLGISFLNEIVNMTDEADLQSHIILNDMRTLIINSLRQTGNVGESRDGMDMTLCIIDKEKMTLDYAGAYNPLIMVRDNELIEYKADKMPIGIHIKKAEDFTHYLIPLQKGDVLYTFSDGYADQFGGPENNKFRKKNFKDLLLEIHKSPLKKQKEILDKTIIDWMNGYEQVDDILVCGIRII